MIPIVKVIDLQTTLKEMREEAAKRWGDKAITVELDLTEVGQLILTAAPRMDG